MYDYNCLMKSSTRYMGNIGVFLYAWAVLFIKGFDFDFEGKKWKREIERMSEGQKIRGDLKLNYR